MKVTSLFARPEKPIELSMNEILKQIQKGEPIFCGKCRQGLRDSPRKGRLLVCSCIKINTNLIANFRIVENHIEVDMILVPDNEFNPDIHVPISLNKKRMDEWDES